MQYYDAFSVVYEYGTEKLHGGHRRKALDLLHLNPGDTVLDVPTGTGANLPLLMERVGATGHVYAVDYSPGMLARARKKVDAAGWDNVTLVESDARLLSSELIGTEQVDTAICMLGLSVIPDWQDVFERIYALVRPGGRVVIMDLFLDGKRTSGLACRYYRTIAQADQRRRFWEPLESLVEDFEVIDHDWFGGVARIVAGTKPIVIDLRDTPSTAAPGAATPSTATPSTAAPSIADEAADAENPAEGAVREFVTPE
ncbi:MAG: methyltransferase domain-containing protein [Actinobacteria bacterium]|nr:methyltransferase domain-containing protein [Actinomycetota bacterium]